MMVRIIPSFVLSEYRIQDGQADGGQQHEAIAEQNALVIAHRAD
ncbi:TPA: hypothetical protein ACSA5P_004675 [Escherichia coli]|nr:hypothetical protein [Escherichia coli]